MLPFHNAVVRVEWLVGKANPSLLPAYTAEPPWSDQQLFHIA
jgi:hypothetical protein